MAYFSQLNSLLNNQKEPRKSDALLAPADPNQQQQQAPSQSTNLQISTPSNAISSAAGNKSEQGQAASDYTKVNPMGKGVASKAIVDANSKGNLQAADIQSYGGNAIADSRNALQDQANNYVAQNTYKQQTQQSDLDSAVKTGDSGAFAKVRSVLNSAPKPVADFAYANANDKNTEDYVKGLNTTEGLQQSLKKQNSNQSDYNDTGATIDAILLGQNAGFKNQQQDLVKQFAGYDKAKQDAVANSKLVQSRFADNEKSERDSVSKYLSGEGESIKAAIQKKLEQTRGNRDTELLQQNKSFQDKGASIFGEYEQKINKMLQDNPEYSTSLGGAQSQFAREKARLSDLEKFISAGSNTLTEADVTSADEAGQFQRINELLGRGDRLTLGGSTPGTNGAFDEAAYRSKLDAIINPGLEAVNKDKERIANVEQSRAIAKAAESGDIKALTSVITGGSNGTVGPTNAPNIPLPSTSPITNIKTTAKSYIPKVLEAAKASPLSPLAPVQQTAQAFKKIKSFFR